MNFKSKTILSLGLLFASSCLITHAATNNVVDCTGQTYEQLANLIALDPFGLEAKIILADCNVERIRTASAIREYIKKLCKALNISSFERDATLEHFSGGKHAGFAFAMLNKQGIIWGQFENGTNSALISIFSRKPFNPQILAKAAQDHFGASKSSFNVSMPSSLSGNIPTIAK